MELRMKWRRKTFSAPSRNKDKTANKQTHESQTEDSSKTREYRKTFQSTDHDDVYAVHKPTREPQIWTTIAGQSEAASPFDECP
jgi:hypothetical protein